MHNYKYLGQERQDELGLNWDTFRHRNYDYAIGRFMCIDPIAEDFVDISTYQFAHNSPVWKVELEGLEGIPFQNLMTVDAAVNPNGVSAHVFGFAKGLGNTAKGLWNAVTNPSQTLKGLGNTALAGALPGIPHSTKQKILNKVDNKLGTSSAKANQALATSMKNGVNKLINGNGQERGEVLGEITGAVVGAKGMNVAVKGVTNALTKTATIGTEAAAIEQTATAPVGRLGSPMDVPPGTNTPAVINGRTFTGHALDQMQGRGLTPTVVDDVIQNGVVTPGNTPGTFVNELNGVRAITNDTGGVISTMPRTH